MLEWIAVGVEWMEWMWGRGGCRVGCLRVVEGREGLGGPSDECGEALWSVKAKATPSCRGQ